MQGYGCAKTYIAYNYSNNITIITTTKGIFFLEKVDNFIYMGSRVKVTSRNIPRPKSWHLQACGVATIIISTTYAGLVGGGEHVAVFSRLPTERGQRIDEAVLARSLLERAPVYVASVGAISAVLGFYGVVVFLRHSVAYLLCVSPPSRGCLPERVTRLEMEYHVTSHAFVYFSTVLNIRVTPSPSVLCSSDTASLNT